MVQKKKKSEYKRYKPYQRVPDGIDVAEGRPEVVSILIDSFNVGMNTTQSCHQAGISRDTFYRWIKKDPVLSDRIEKAKTSTERLAKATIRMKLQSENEELKTDSRADIPTTRWWAERVLRDEYSTRSENENKNINFDVQSIRELFDEDISDKGEGYESAE